MTQTDPSNIRGFGQGTCPRCEQPITFRSDMATIYPHRDNLVGARCPMGGVDIDQARRLIREHRERLREMAR